MTTEASQEVVLWLGQTQGYWIQTVAYFLAAFGALAAALVAGFQLRALRQQMAAAEKGAKAQTESSERMSRLRATVEVVRHEQTDKELLEAQKKYAELRERPGALTALAVSHPEPTEDNGLVMRMLNNYEYVSTGIHVGAFDEEIYKRMKRSNLIRDWDALKPYVCELRRKYGKPKLFIELENLAEKWRNHP